MNGAGGQERETEATTEEDEAVVEKVHQDPDGLFRWSHRSLW